MPVSYDDGELYGLMWEYYQNTGPKLSEPPAPSKGSNIASRPIMVMATEKSKKVLFEFAEVQEQGLLSKFKPLGSQWVSDKDLDKQKVGNQAGPVKLSVGET